MYILHLNGRIISSETPAKPDETVIFVILWKMGELWHVRFYIWMHVFSF